jgi:hypothetical protein
MKTIKISLFIILTGAVLGLMSCKKYLDINQDPNQSTTSTATLQLPTAQLYIGQAIGDRIAEILNIYSQYWTGGPGTALNDWDQNFMSTTDVNQVFNDLYRANSNFNYIINSTNESYYIAISKLLKAYNTQIIADLFGDAPYTNALKGDISEGLILSPEYNSAKDVIYPALETEIMDGLRLLDTVDATLTHPGPEDLIYGGDLDKWRKFGNSLLLKVYLRQGASAKFTELWETEPDLIWVNDDNAAIEYSTDAKGRNPLWTDLLSSIGNTFVASKTSIDYLLSTGDPRINFFYDPTNAGTHVGLKQGDVQNSPPTANYSIPSGANDEEGGLIFGPEAPVFLMTAWEVNLIVAEGAARGWISEDPATYYYAAIDENGAYLGVDSASLATYKAGGGAYKPNQAIRSIALQKWVSMNGLQPVEAWIETRRLDNPSNPLFTSPGGLFQVPTNNVLGGRNFPSILLYPAAEQDLNTKFPGQHQLTDKVFWDN